MSGRDTTPIDRIIRRAGEVTAHWLIPIGPEVVRMYDGQVLGSGVSTFR